VVYEFGLFFLEERITLWHWLRRDWKGDQSSAECIHFQLFSTWRTVDWRHGENEWTKD